MQRVANNQVWQQTRSLFIAAGLLFLINIYFGFDNALTVGVIPRWQILIHLHGASIGWITLSLIGLAIWVFTDQQQVSQTYVGRVRALVWIAIVVFAGYIPSFGLAFSRGAPFVYLLPIFGTSAMLVIWAAAIYAVSQLRRQPVLTTVHLLVSGGLIVAAVGATMGVLLGLESVIGRYLPIGGDRVGLHAGMMDAYLLLVASGVVEWFVLKDAARRWTWAGLAQTLAGTVAAILVPIAFLTNAIDVILPLFGILLLLFLVLFLARTGWRGMAANPFRTGVGAWGFFGALWLVVYVGVFLYAVIALEGDPTAAPAWFGALFVHSGFVGMMTNLLFGVFSARTRQYRHVLSWGEPTALWLMNLGLVVFLGLRIFSDSRLGAIVMGIGVLVGVATMIWRLLAAAGEAGMPAKEPAVMGGS